MTSPPLLRRELCERSAIVVLQHGANALDDELLTALAAELEALIAAGGPPLVLRSAHPTIFVPALTSRNLTAAAAMTCAA